MPQCILRRSVLPCLVIVSVWAVLRRGLKCVTACLSRWAILEVCCKLFVHMCRCVAAAIAYACASFHQYYRKGRCRGNADAGQIPCYGESGPSCIMLAMCLVFVFVRWLCAQIETLAKRFDRECAVDSASFLVGAGKYFCCTDCKR